MATALFNEWEKELKQYSNSRFRRESKQQLQLTQQHYHRLLRAMRKAKKSIEPVLTHLHDNTLYLKHNLNARAISSLKNELNTVDITVNSLIVAMEKSIRESDAFIEQLKAP